MEKRNLTCIGCPMGCALLVEMDGKEIISVTGNTCKKRCGICSEGSDRSDQDRDNDRACEEWKHAGGVSKDSTGYSERKDF